MTKRVYKFISAQYGVSNLRDHHLKLSTIDELNDPFDLCPVDTTDPEIRYAIENLGVWFRQTSAILCFSRNWDNLLLWSHYGACHAGICLGVLYQPNVLKMRKEEVNLSFVDRLLRTKHESWSYEQEVRMFVKVNDPPDEKGLLWMDFGPNLELKEVIIGSQCKPENSDAVVEALKPYGHSVKCWWAGMRQDSFLLVRLEGAPWWHADVKRTRMPVS
jgi:hypothetical protein